MLRGRGLRSSNPIKRQHTAFESLETRQLMSTTSATMVVGQQLYTAVDGSGANDGSDLYVSNLDGSNQSLLKHWNYGNSINLNTLFAYKGNLLFAASVTNNSVLPEPWISDGTSTGTQQLADLHQGGGGSDPSAYHLVNGVAVFTAQDNSPSDVQLWAYDGASPVHLLGRDGSPFTSGVKNVVYTNSSVTWDETSDSSSTLLHFTSDGQSSQYIDSNGVTNSYAVVGTQLFTISGRSLYVSDLNGANAQLLQTWNSDNDPPTDPVAFNGKIYFAAGRDPTTSYGIHWGAEIWSSDGTVAGTKFVIELTDGSLGSKDRNLHVLNGNLLFIANEQDAPYGTLFTSDGTRTGTHALKGPGFPTGFATPFDMAYSDQTLNFSIGGGDGFAQRWTTDGTVANTRQLYTITPSNGILTFNYQNIGAQTESLTLDSDGYLEFAATYTGNGTLIRKFVASTVKEIHISAGFTASTITIDPSVTIPTTLTGSTHDDTLSGGANVHIDGNGGNDIINGVLIEGSGDDTTTGGTGDDNGGGSTVTNPPTINAHLSNGFLRVYGTDADNVINFTMSGSDIVVSVDGVTASFAFADVKDIVVHAGAGNDTIQLNGIAMKTNLYGEAGNDSLYGGAGKDRIYGGDGDDWISGGDNHDTLYGEAGNDRLFGDNGHDYLVGGAGTNVLRGGASFDHLIFSSTDDIHGNVGDRLTVDSIVG